MRTKSLLLLALILLGLNRDLPAQENNKKASAIVREGKALFRSEMASWSGTDVFLENFSDKMESIGGYFSYTEGDSARCIFFNRNTEPKVMATIFFDSTFNPATARVDSVERSFSTYEYELFTIRSRAVEEIGRDTLFKTYTNTSLNLIPLILDGERKVFIITGPQQEGVVLFGNDYLITFDNKNQVKEKKALHTGLIVTEYGEGRTSEKNDVGAMHTHVASTGEYITSTDICTLMLYERIAGWDQYIVISEKYISIWNCTTDDLFTITKKAWNRINKDQKKRQKKQAAR